MMAKWPNDGGTDWAQGRVAIDLGCGEGTDALERSGFCAHRSLRLGTRDTQAGDPDMTFNARHQVEVLLDGLDIVRLEETERDGHAFSGPKHWHTVGILARKPVSKRPSAPASR